MPNWCENKLSVTSPTPELLAYLKEHGFSFGRILPVEQLDDDTRQISWQAAVWGTKWDLDDMEGNLVASDLTNSGEAFFDTAWSPPLPVIEALSRMFPGDAFRLDYHEPGMIFAGRAVCRAGNTDDTYFEGEADVNHVGREVFGWEYDADGGGEDIPEPTTPDPSNQSCQTTVPPPAATTSPCGTKPRSVNGPDGSA